MAALVTGIVTTTATIEESPIDLESPDLTERNIALDAGLWIRGLHGEMRRAIEKCLWNGNEDPAWRVVSIEERSESLYVTGAATCTYNEPVYSLEKTLATFDIVAAENGPTARVEDGKLVAIPRRKLRLKAELAGDGTLKIVESEVDAPKRRYL